MRLPCVQCASQGLPVVHSRVHDGASGHPRFKSDFSCGMFGPGDCWVIIVTQSNIAIHCSAKTTLHTHAPEPRTPPFPPPLPPACAASRDSPHLVVLGRKVASASECGVASSQRVRVTVRKVCAGCGCIAAVMNAQIATATKAGSIACSAIR
jgi:hypothetical protein